MESPRIEELRRRVQTDPASIAFAALAEEYRKAGRFDDAIATCTTGLKRHPSYLSAHVTLGRALIEVGRFDEARDELELVLHAAPENLAAIRGLAEIHHRHGRRPAPVHVDTEPQEDSAPVLQGTFGGPAASAAVELPSPPAEIAVRVDDPVQPPAGIAPADSDPLVEAQVRVLEDFLERIQRTRGSSLTG